MSRSDQKVNSDGQVMVDDLFMNIHDPKDTFRVPAISSDFMHALNHAHHLWMPLSKVNVDYDRLNCWNSECSSTVLTVKLKSILV